MLERSQIFSARLSALRISLGLEGDLLPFGQSMKARTLDRADVNKYVRPPIVRLNKAKAFLAVEPLHNTRRHFRLQLFAKHVVAHTACEHIRSSGVLGGKSPTGAAIKAAR